MGTQAFRRVEEVRGYPIAGSLVWYLVEHFGVEPLLDQFRGAAREDSATVIMTRFDRAYGRSLTAVEQDWRAFLSARSSRSVDTQ